MNIFLILLLLYIIASYLLMGWAIISDGKVSDKSRDDNLINLGIFILSPLTLILALYFAAKEND